LPHEITEIRFDVQGRSVRGVLADGSGGRPAPGILVVHEGRGFTQHAQDRAGMLADLGYVAFAPDYMGGFGTSLAHSFELMKPFADDKTLFATYGLAALDVLRAHGAVDASRLAAIGFCWGGFAVLELACHADLRCVVGFHPGLSLGPLSRPEKVAAKVLISVGDEDPYVPMSDILDFMKQARAANIDTQVQLLVGAPHSFTNPEPYIYETGEANVGYEPTADRRSWAAMRALFAEALDPA
jgi:dienelactone hydrolase